MNRFGAAALWLALFGCHLRSAAPTFCFEDGPELAACAATLGNTHPPGYPLLMLAGRLALLWPAGAPAFRLNAAGAACAAGAAVVLGALAARFGGAAAAGCFAAAVWGLSDTVWWEAGIGDKYAPYYLAFLLLVAAGARLCESDTDRPRRTARLGLAAGLAGACHLYAVFALPVAFAGLLRSFRRHPRGVPRAALLALAFALPPLSLRALYPPLRSAGAAALDWGRPDVLPRLLAYAPGRLYRTAFAASSLRVHPGLWLDRLAQAARFLADEVPLPLLLAAPFGAAWLARRRPWLAAGQAGCALADAAYALNFSEKIVRWYEPALALTVLAAAIGWARAAVRVRGGPAWLALLAVLGPAWQWERGAVRNDLSRFTAAHDFARNLLRGVPVGALYLGAGDFDLFPLWALRYAEGERVDVEAVGLASFVEPGLAGAGNQRRFLADRGLPPEGLPALRAVLSAPGMPPVRTAAAGYDRALVAAMPFLRVHRSAGLAAAPTRGWDPAGSFAATRRAERAYTYRGFVYAPAGAVTRLERLRDEVARGALLQYPGCFASLGVELARFGLARESAWGFAKARRAMAALAGPLPVRAPGAVADRFAVAEGYVRLADALEGRGATFLAGRMRENIAAVAP